MKSAIIKNLDTLIFKTLKKIRNKVFKVMLNDREKIKIIFT